MLNHRLVRTIAVSLVSLAAAAGTGLAQEAGSSSPSASDAQKAAATAKLDEARKAIYLILAE